MTDLECKLCGYYADKVQDISWHDGYSWAEVTVYCNECDADTVHEFRDSVPTREFEYKGEA